MKGLDFLNSLEQWNGKGGFHPQNIKKAMDYFDNPQDKIASIHVAGTNGKGSVSAALSSILAKEGCRVGLNISPHLVRINERIVVDGYSISDELLNEAALELKDCLNKLKITLTYHEALTAIAFIVYEWKKLDWIVVEVGLGGRLDASNILDCPKACVISSIGLDHQDILGSTKVEIAKEKAGIIKRGSKLFCGRMDAESLGILKGLAESLGVETSSWGASYKAEIVAKERSNVYTMRYMDLKCNETLSFQPSLRGTFQRDNMALAINVARSLNISPESCIKGVQEVFWPARFEKLNIGTTCVILDCAHNIDGINALVESLELEGLKDLNLAFGCLQTKNWQEMLKILMPYVNKWNLLLPQSTRAVPNEVVSDFLSCFDIKVQDYGSDYQALLRENLNGGVLLVAGSMYMVGALRALLVKEEQALWQFEKV